MERSQHLFHCGTTALRPLDTERFRQPFAEDALHHIDVFTLVKPQFKAIDTAGTTKNVLRIRNVHDRDRLRGQSGPSFVANDRRNRARLELIADYLYLLADHTWPEDVDAALRAGLELASGKPWREAADALWNHANQTARIYGSHGERERDEDGDENGEVAYGE